MSRPAGKLLCLRALAGGHPATPAVSSLTPPADSDAWALTVVLCLFEVFFEISIATLSWVIACEICPLEIRSVGAGFHCMGDLMLQILFSQLNLTMVRGGEAAERAGRVRRTMPAGRLLLHSCSMWPCGCTAHLALGCAR